MTCWHGHIPGMSEAQLAQACEAYYRAAYNRAWAHAWQSPMNPYSYQPEQQVTWGAGTETPERDEPHTRARVKTSSLETARVGDKTGAIDVEFVRVR